MSALLPSPAVWLCMLVLCFIAALPFVFFRRGRLNANWWLTAAPFATAGAGLVYGWLRAPPPGGMLDHIAVLLAAAAIALIAFTLGTHTEPVSLWHQPDDTPARLVMHGAYARIRHPFYGAFLLGLAACALAAPNILTLLAAATGAVQLRRTARREERRLAAAFGADYVAYMLRTGRFLPRLSRTRAAAGAGGSAAPTTQAAADIPWRSLDVRRDADFSR